MKRVIYTLLFFTYFTGSAQLPSYVPANGLVSWWQFSGNAADGSANAHDGTVYGAVLCPDRFGADSSAYYFAGNNQQIRCGNDTLLTNHTSFSVSLWFNVENRISGWQQNVMIANIGTYNASGGFEIFTNNPPNADITGMFRNTTFADQVLQTASLVSIDTAQWHHAIYTIEYFPGIDSTKSSIYLDNSLIKEQYYFHSITWSGLTPIVIGTNIDSVGYQRSFKGKIDDIGIWNRVLSQQEIADLFIGPTVSVNEPARSNELLIFPNPSSSEVYLVFPDPYRINADAFLYDMQGQMVKKLSIAVSPGQLKTKFSIDALPRGIYTIQILSGQEQWLTKIVKE